MDLGGPPTVTYHMNRLQSIDADVELCVTLNRSEEIDPARIIRRIDYSHPVLHPGGRSRAKPARLRSAARTVRTTAARTGVGAFTRMGSRAHFAWYAR